MAAGPAAAGHSGPPGRATSPGDGLRLEPEVLDGKSRLILAALDKSKPGMKVTAVMGAISRLLFSSLKAKVSGMSPRLFIQQSELSISEKDWPKFKKKDKTPATVRLLQKQELETALIPPIAQEENFISPF